MRKIFDEKDFLEGAKLMAELIVKLRTKFNQVEVHPSSTAGFLRETHGESAPTHPTELTNILHSLQKDLFPNLTHWQSPKFYAYFPSTVSHVAVLADMFAQSFHSPGFSYSSSPAHSEIESLVVDWCARALGLPQDFTFSKGGGGCIVTSNSEGQVVSVHMAKQLAKKLKTPMSKLVAYYSKFSHISVIKAVHFKQVENIREVPCVFDQTLQNYTTDLAALETMLREDVSSGLVPCWYGATLGSTSSGACDNLLKLGPLCRQFKMMLSVDAAYLGGLFHLQEQRPKGMQFVDLLLVNYSKTMLVGNVGSLLFVRDRHAFKDAMGMGLPGFYILGHEQTGTYAIDFKDFNISLGRRMNALKIYFVYRYFGLEGIQQMHRDTMQKAAYFAAQICKQGRFQIYARPIFGLVCFRAVAPEKADPNSFNRQFADRVSKSSLHGYMTPSSQNGVYFLRFVVCNPGTTTKDIDQFVKYLHECLQ